MLVRTLTDVIGSAHDADWKNGTSRRLVVASDERGFTVTDTEVKPGTETTLRYNNHLEACYCIEGCGVVITEERTFEIGPGTMYAPDQAELHTLRSDEGMRLICVFNPALSGDETHVPIPGEPSGF